MRESNSRPLAPKARIIPLDQSPNTQPAEEKNKQVGKKKKKKKKNPTPTRFELARAEPIGFQNQLLNHSDTVPFHKKRNHVLGRRMHFFIFI